MHPRGTHPVRGPTLCSRESGLSLCLCSMWSPNTPSLRSLRILMVIFGAPKTPSRLHSHHRLHRSPSRLPKFQSRQGKYGIVDLRSEVVGPRRRMDDFFRRSTSAVPPPLTSPPHTSCSRHKPSFFGYVSAEPTRPSWFSSLSP